MNLNNPYQNITNQTSILNQALGQSQTKWWNYVHALVNTPPRMPSTWVMMGKRNDDERKASIWRRIKG